MAHFLVVFLVLLSVHCIVGVEKSLVDYYENLIRTNVEKAKNYEYKTNASQYRATKNSTNQSGLGCYDFVVIGSGSSGSVVANRLSEISNWRILLLEAGNLENNFTDIPVMTTVSTLSDYNWGYKSVPQKSACLAMVDRMCEYPRGRALGGTTVINGLAYSRGIPKSFEMLSELNITGWSYKEVLPYFMKSEHFQWNEEDAVVDLDYHNVNGPLDVTYHVPRSKELPYYMEANKELGYNIVDLNGPNPAGVGPAPMNIRQGKRFSGYRAFLEPIRRRKNLHILPDSLVTKLEINDQKRVTGVSFVTGGVQYLVKVRNEVIVSAGAIGSPQLLMLSGIGPEEHLKQLNIPVVQNLSVGNNLVDHLGLGVFFSSNLPLEQYSLRKYVEQYLVGYGGLSAPGPNDAFGFYQTKEEPVANYPDLEIILAPNYGNVTEDMSEKTMNLKPENVLGYIPQNSSLRTFRIDFFALHTKSRGTVRLRSNSPYEYPNIDPNCLTDADNKDLKTMYEGLQIVLKLMNTKAMRSIKAQLQPINLPGCKQYSQGSKDHWYCVIKQLGHPVNHPFGTCSMGKDPKLGAVVDSDLKVFGIQNLRVADASIFPIPLTGHPNGPCVMVGEKVSAIIKKHYNKC